MAKRSRITGDEEAPSRNTLLTSDDRCDPKSRGIHEDAIRAEADSPSSRAKCVACNKLIMKHTPRWGIKYAGNPLSISIIPLYGNHPMHMWCHAGGCGLNFVRLSPEMPAAARTCHACEDTPSTEGLRLLCGGPPNQHNKIRQHAFHIQCWLKSISSVDDEDAKKQLLISPTDIGKDNKLGLAWKDLTEDEQDTMRLAWNEYAI